MSDPTREDIMARLSLIGDHHPDFCDCGQWSQSDPCDAISDAADAVLDLFAPALRAAKAEAWDEGYRLDWTGGASWTNPYRQEAEQ